ncbi:thioredoxin-dependent thiol peroxidase [Thermospira aquatica]|uniref:thioredoxin-dependent peroxiredoxin n=1 Tax=Thermospira aquatica TaxID=2828656 RepID=A0AAX3BBR5_9SPIR|nr:thioredoxin-dependent thiol peroxidase [Thermospira aquatica]URA09528.1 thioredoxin-dependent thiol peroxidase [Thermospira aquatica]
MLQKGEKAPDFHLQTTEGEISLSQFQGKKVVLYFYPKDDTPGCTKEACGFRDVYDQILAKGAVVIGISADSVDSHQKFKKKYNLPFYLASDPDHSVLKTYGAWGEKKMYGKVFPGIIRSTYVIDEHGTIIAVFPKVSPEKHAEEILALL